MSSMRRPPDSTWELFHHLKTHLSWGYVIYRTTYTPESEPHFSAVIKYLEACIKEEFFEESAKYASNGGDPAIYEGIWAQHSSTVIEDAAQFNRASIDAIRAHFEAWVDAQGQRDKFNKYRMCIVIDEECLQTLLSASVETLDQEAELAQGDTVRYVKVVEAWPNLADFEPFPGWMKCWPLALWDLWTMMCDSDDMGLSWSKIDDFCPEVYCE
ncbi:hypothetical protein F1880_003869 [Penicillium rolfsii]|nr:hypothetical protein F1880_003869 [Penicillium rolfsii]